MLIPMVVSISQAFRKGLSSNRCTDILRLMSIALFTITQIFNTVLLIVRDNISLSEETNNILQCIPLFLWLTAKSILLIYFVNRFYYAFVDYPQYQISKQTYFALYTMIILYWTIELLTVINHILRVNLGLYGPYEANLIGIFGNFFAKSVDGVVSICIIHSFTNSIVSLIWNHEENTDIMLDILTRYFILLLFSIITTFVLSICLITSYIVYLSKGPGSWVASSDNDVLDHIANYAWQIDCISNAYCLFFERDNTKKYYRICCISGTRLHGLCKNMFKGIAVKRSSSHGIFSNQYGSAGLANYNSLTSELQLSL